MKILPTRVPQAPLFVLIALGLTACAGGAAESAAPAAGDGGSAAAIDTGLESSGVSSDLVTLVATEFAYDPSSLTIPADMPVEIVLDNQGAVEHDITLEDREDQVVSVAAGDTGSGTVTLESGSYTFYCAVPGHREAGMEGTITAE